ncbi:hypothetical protein EKO04_009031 [Ascochyta lentis]|uniref:Uncharacterized protein n=1 Tax=Ascochyta lentis TaxID=205686 RepID=A0A8H7MFG2_9PLEO|nr:hypothetical protein EKO04_009031 [Ascochyta lentis]
MEQGSEMDNARIYHDHVRALCALASSMFVMEKNLRYDSLRLLAQLPPRTDPAWVRAAYLESQRALSMDAGVWMDWETPACPWTTWKVSWADEKIQRVPCTKPPSRWKELLLRRHQPRPFSRKARDPHTAVRKGPLVDTEEDARKRADIHVVDQDDADDNEEGRSNEREGLQRKRDKLRQLMLDMFCLSCVGGGK